MNNNCFEMAMEVIKEADKVIGRRGELNTEYLDIFKQYCGVIDYLIEDNYVEEYSFSIDKMSQNIRITMISNDFQVLGNITSGYYQLLKRSVSFGFYSKYEKVAVYIEFPSLWD